MIFSSVFTIRISLGIVDVLSRQVAAETLRGDLEFLGDISVGQKSTEELLAVFRFRSRTHRTMITFMMVCKLVLLKPPTSTA